MKSIMNFRAIFYIFIAFALGIGFAYYLFSPNFFIISLAISLAFIILFISIKYKKLYIFVSLITAFIIGIGACFLSSYLFKGNDYKGEKVNIFGRVSDNLVVTDTYATCTLTNVTIDGKNDKNISIILFSHSEEMSVGSYMSFSANVYNYALFENDSFNYFPFHNNSPYFATDIKDVVIEAGDITIAENIKSSIKEMFSSSMSPNSADLAFAILFGEQSHLNEDLRQDFTDSGITHLLAVSGLNTMFLVGFLFMLINKFGLKKWQKFMLLFFILLLYCFLCNWTASVIRASIMSLVFIASGMLGGRYDMFSSIGLSGIILLIFSPLMVFDIGFILSFLCVIAIAFFTNPLTKFFQKCKLSKRLSEALAIDTATNIAVFPVLIVYFGQISLVTTFTNLICIPLFGLAFILLFVFMLIVAVFGFLAPIFMIPDVLIRIVGLTADFFANLDFAVLKIESFSFLIVFAYMFIMLFFSCLVVASIKVRSLLACFVIMIAYILGALTLTPLPPTTNTYTQLNSTKIASVITTKNGEVLVLAEPDSLGDVRNFLLSKRMQTVDCLIVMCNGRITPSKTDATLSFVKEFSIQSNIFDFSTNGLGTVEYKNVRNSTGNYNIFGVNFEFIFINNINKAIDITFDGVRILLGFDNVGTSQQAELYKKFENIQFDLVFSKSESFGHFASTQSENRISQKVFEYDYILPNQKTKDFSLYLDGNFTFEINNGIMTMK